MEPQLPLIDHYGRKIRKLRVSLLDACNLRCTYCMPTNPTFLAPAKWPSRAEIKRISSVLVNLGIEEIRLTGGEPTLRRDLVDIAADLSELPLHKLGLTTNGLLLGKILEPLRDTRCQHLNISLDSLRPSVFKDLARRDGFDATVAAILRAKDLGFKVKINTVVIRGVNDGEIPNFIRFSSKHSIEVRFLEMMAIGVAHVAHAQQFVSAREILESIQNEFTYTAVGVAADSTSICYKTDSGAQFGIIAPVTQSFCGTCSRWRLSADGSLMACLMATKGVQLAGQSEDRIRELCYASLAMKPASGAVKTPTMMHAIGG